MAKRKTRISPAATKVTLVVPQYGISREFGIQHAERLLDMGKNNGGWELPENSEFEYDKENGLKYKSNTGDNSEAEA